MTNFMLMRRPRQQTGPKLGRVSRVGKRRWTVKVGQGRKKQSGREQRQQRQKSNVLNLREPVENATNAGHVGKQSSRARWFQSLCSKITGRARNPFISLSANPRRDLLKLNDLTLI